MQLDLGYSIKDMIYISSRLFEGNMFLGQDLFSFDYCLICK